MSLTAKLAGIGKKKIFHELMSSGDRNESSHQLTRIGERKIFHELDVHHV